MLYVLVISASLHFVVLTLLAVAWCWPTRKQKEGKVSADPQSVAITLIIAARNEAANLRQFLPSALNQDIAVGYEVIVVLDRCSDDSAMVVQKLQVAHPQLRVIEIEDLPEGWTGKKYALHRAIDLSQSDCLAFTDADCALTRTWLSGMWQELAGNRDLVLGLSPYTVAPSFLNLLIRFETWITALLYIGLARLGMPYMGVGRSIAYRKSWFQAAGGFDAIAHRLSGDDDLLVNHHARAGRLGYQTALENQVLSVPQSSWKAWRMQKTRHGSAGTAYKFRSLLILSLIHGLHLIFYLSLVVVLCLQTAPDWALVIYLLRTMGLMAVLATLPWRDKRYLILAFPILDLCYLIYLVLLIPAAAFIQPKWNHHHGGSV